jgi:hypothetical protein
MIARSLHSAGHQACSPPRVRVADACLGAAILSRRSDGSCDPRTVASQKTDNSVLGLLALYPARTRFGWNGEEPLHQISIA